MNIDIPERFQELLKPGTVHKIQCFGNFTAIDILKRLQSICKEVIYVSGDLYEKIPNIKETHIIKINSLSFGLIHGHQICPLGDPDDP